MKVPKIQRATAINDTTLIAALPEAAQVLVADFVAFLKQRYTAAPCVTRCYPSDRGY